MTDPRHPGRRIALPALGNPRDAHTQSGVPAQVLTALEAHVDVVGLDISLSNVQRALAAATVPTPDRLRWRTRMHRSALGTTFRTRNLRSQVATRGRIDLVLPIRSMYRPLPLSYTPYIDVTLPLISRVYPQAIVWRDRGLRDAVRRERSYLRGASHVFTTGRLLARSVIEDYGIDEDRVTVVGGGAHFAPQQLPINGRVAESILFVGYDFERKGGPDLVRAFRQVRAQLPRATLTIVGSTVSNQDPGVTVIGQVRDRAAMAELYSRASVFAFPSRWEPYGMALLEAMAHSLPCVATSVNAIPDILVDGQTGLLVPPRDPDRLAEALLRLLREPERAHRMGDAGRERIEAELQWKHVVARMLPGIEASLRASGASSAP